MASSVLLADRAHRKTRVLIVDDSAVVRKMLTSTIAAESDLEVVGTAPDAFVARDKILQLKPDVITLDIEMPGMNGLVFLKKLMQYCPTPVIVISSLGTASCAEALEALRCGAVEVLAKPAGPYSIGDLRFELGAKLRAAASSNVTPMIGSKPPVSATRIVAMSAAAPNAVAPRKAAIPTRPANPRQVIAIGASTGGTSAIQDILTQLSPNSPGIVITQHIPAAFSMAFARRLDQICPFEVKEATDGDSLQPGRVLIAPGDFHMLLRRSGNGYRVDVKSGPKVCYQRPSVDVMFASVSEAAGSNAIGVLLTGMGADGAQGMATMKGAGAKTIAQDEASCVVYGMPREAVRLGGVGRVAPLSEMATVIAEACR